MWSEERHTTVDYLKEVKSIYDSVVELVTEINNSNVCEAPLGVELYKSKNGYMCVDVIVIKSDITLYTAFKTTLSKTTHKYIVPLDYMLDKEAISKSILTRIEQGMWRIFN